MDQLNGTVESIIYTQTDNGFTVAKLKELSKKELTVVVGTLPCLQPGEVIFCQGQWKIHPSHGKQFEIQSYTVEMPSDVAGIQKYLESGLVKGIGPIYAKKIVAKFGAKTLQVIEETPHRLDEIEGLGKKKIQKLVDCWKEQKAVRDVMIFLRTYGVSPAYAQKIFKSYGNDSIQKVRENPYQLAKDVFGIGFKLADVVAQKLGFPLHSPKRISAGIEFALWELSLDGHTCYPRIELIPVVHALLEVDSLLIEQELDRLIQEKILVEQTALVWLGPFFGYESSIAQDLLRLAQSRQAIRSIDAMKAASWVQTHLKIEFAPEQKEAIIKALTDKVHIITGGPGTGKSTITNAILTITEKLTNKILLAAPTGRAAKRLTQITRRKAFTIHALLEMNFTSRGFKKDRNNPLDCDLILIDEASMIDTPLLFYLLKAIPSHARMLFVGDIDQLPSVGPGTVLKDIIESELIGITRLTEIFRQAKGSRIITNAHRINHGEFPSLNNPPHSDFHFIETETPENIQQVIIELMTREIPSRWKMDPIEDIQVLSPMKKGLIGAEMLNHALQGILNPSNTPLLRAGQRFHLKDKVMQIKNNYDKKIYNGDIGRIQTFDLEEELLTVLFDDRLVEYDFSELDEMVLAYATSVHKYQGSEAPCILIPIHTSHFKLLHRNLLYTAVTRGKKQVYLIGTKKAIGIAIHNDQVKKRYTGLKSNLINTAPTYKPPQEAQLRFENF